ncbi:MAG: Maf family protein [Planctomycetia bacterium]|nr:Maf family protein [Planctomycetia bacterium]
MNTEKNRDLILASRSPRRADLLREAGYDFQIYFPVHQEDPIQKEEPPEEYVRRLALHKAEECVQFLPQCGHSKIILACDSLAVCKKEILGKPKDEEDARRMLRLLSDSVHYVHTGLCLIRKDPDREIRRLTVDSTRLKMDSLSEQTIEDYIASGLWREKAGAFGYQDGNDWLHIESGSASNVVGLPMELFQKLYQELLQIPQTPDCRTSNHEPEK